MTELEFRQRMDEFNAIKSFTTADEAFYAKLDKLTEDTKAMINANTDDLVAENGKTYYVSNNGDDSADGLSPETAWATCDKVTEFSFEEGDVVVFRRGDKWLGGFIAQSGVSYSAYGSGAKPKIFKCHDGKKGEWLKTDRENVWRYSEVFADDTDIAVIVFNDGECYAEKKRSRASIENDLDFFFSTRYSDDEAEPNFDLLLKCEKGNPNDVFWQIDISYRGGASYNSIIKTKDYSHDITFKNLELRYGQDIFFLTGGKNINMSYCVCGWTGGMMERPGGVRFGGGAGGWLYCDGMHFDHCHIYQQFDSGVTPQYHWTEPNAGIFRDFTTTDCLFEQVEYTLEYFHTQKNVKFNGYEGLIFNYNLCRTGGYGFGDKTEESRYVKTWGHENTCVCCEIAHNIFDRAASQSLEIIGHNFGDNGNNISYESIPKLHNNVYIEPQNKKWANINKVIYPFNEVCQITLERLDVDKNSTYIYSE